MTPKIGFYSTVFDGSHQNKEHNKLDDDVYFTPKMSI